MGIDVHGLHCLEYAKQFGDFGQTVTLGRQHINLSSHLLKKRFGNTVNWENERFCEGLLKNYFGATKTDSIDNSSYENASLIHDMNQPFPHVPQEYDTVIDLGTTEHIFNISQALNNMISLCRPGGQILHVSPTNNFCGHGFWQISPELFFSLYSEQNGFKHTEVFIASRKARNTWYKVKKPMAGQRVPLVSRTKIYAICRTVLVDKTIDRQVQQSDYVAAWEQNNADDQRQKHGLKAWLHRRILHKYFRGVYGLNPNLIRMRIPYHA